MRWRRPVRRPPRSLRRRRLRQRPHRSPDSQRGPLASRAARLARSTSRTIVSEDAASRQGVCVMVARRHFSPHGLFVPILMVVLAAALSSCGGRSDAPQAGTRAPDAAPPAVTAPSTPTPPPAPPPRELTWSGKVDMGLWSPGRVKAYKAALQQHTPPTLAILRIPRLDLEVPVYDGTTDAVLD